MQVKWPRINTIDVKFYWDVSCCQSQSVTLFMFVWRQLSARLTASNRYCTAIWCREFLLLNRSLRQPRYNVHTVLSPSCVVHLEGTCVHSASLWAHNQETSGSGNVIFLGHSLFCSPPSLRISQIAYSGREGGLWKTDAVLDWLIKWKRCSKTSVFLFPAALKCVQSSGSMMATTRQRVLWSSLEKLKGTHKEWWPY